MNYQYYLDTLQPTPSLRRYAFGQVMGHRWDIPSGQWSPRCAPRESCVLTHDRLIPAAEAERLFPGSTKEDA